MVGSAVATMVWSSAASSIPSTIATKIRFRRCGVIGAPLPASSTTGMAWVAACDVALGLVIPAFPSAFDANGCPGEPAAISRRVSCWQPGLGDRARWPGHALRQVQLFAQLFHQLQLGLEVVDVVFLVGDDLLEEDGARTVFFGAAHDDAGLETGQYLILDREVGLELLAQRLADTQREEALVVRQAIQQQDAVGDGLGVAHLVERLRAGVLGYLGEAPVLLHFRVQKVLVDRGQLTGQLLVE